MVTGKNNNRSCFFVLTSNDVAGGWDRILQSQTTMIQSTSSYILIIKFAFIFIFFAIAGAKLTVASDSNGSSNDNSDRSRRHSQSAFSPYARTCKLVFSAITLEEYVKVMKRSELTRDTLTQAQQEFVRQVLSQPWIARIEASIVQAGVSDLLLQHFSKAVSLKIHARDAQANEVTKEILNFLRNIGARHVSLSEIQSSVRTIAANPKIYPSFAMASFILRNMPSVERLFIQLQNSEVRPGFQQLQFPGAAYIGPVIGGPRQAEMVRAVLQYTTSTPNDHVVEIGYGTPAVLLAYRYYTGVKNITGVDPFVLPERANDILNPVGIELLEGLFPDDQSVDQRIREKGPVHTLMALDTIKEKKHNVMETSENPQNVARRIYDLLAPGGMVVIMNDFEGEPYFTEQQAEVAGFTIIRWGEIRELPGEVRRLMPAEVYSNPLAGRFKLVVLRKGLPRDHENIQIISNTVPKP